MIIKVKLKSKRVLKRMVAHGDILRLSMSASDVLRYVDSGLHPVSSLSDSALMLGRNPTVGHHGWYVDRAYIGKVKRYP